MIRLLIPTALLTAALGLATFVGSAPIAEPTKVAPRETTITNAGPSFTHLLPARSITVLRLKAG